MPRRQARYFLVATAVGLLAGGCAHYEPKPLSAGRAATEWQTRSLADTGLRAFIETNLGRPLESWPPTTWDLRLLTLAAFYYHPDLDVARARWGVAEAGTVTAGSRPNPKIGASVDHDSPVASGQSPWTYQLSLDIPIEVAGKRGYRLVQAEQLSAAARLALAETAWTVRSRLRAALVNHLLAVRVAGSLRAEENIQTQYVALLESRFALGELPRPLVDAARLNLHQAQLQAQAADGRVTETRIALAQNLGVPASALAGLMLVHSGIETLPAVEALPADAARGEALLNRLDIRRALAEYAATETALQLEVARQYPDVTLGPAYQWTATGVKWALGVSLALPLLDRNEGRIAEANARREESAARFLALQGGIIAQSERAWANYRAALEEYATAQKLLAAATARERDVRRLYALGNTDFVAAVGAQLEAARARRARLDVLRTAQLALGALEDLAQIPFEAGLTLPAVPERSPRARAIANRQTP